MMLKYCIRPGHVKSTHDGDIHFVGAAQLARLYHVPPGTYRVHRQAATIVCNNLVHLSPRADGAYFDVTERYPDGEG